MKIRQGKNYKIPKKPTKEQMNLKWQSISDLEQRIHIAIYCAYMDGYNLGYQDGLKD